MLVLPNPTKFAMMYENRRGEVKRYEVVPISREGDSFVAYAFGRGVRRFRNQGVVSIL